jgi:hypothetical protein
MIKPSQDFDFEKVFLFLKCHVKLSLLQKAVAKMGMAEFLPCKRRDSRGVRVQGVSAGCALSFPPGP